MHEAAAKQSLLYPLFLPDQIFHIFGTFTFIYYVAMKRLSTQFKALNLWNVRSGIDVMTTQRPSDFIIQIFPTLFFFFFARIYFFFWENAHSQQMHRRTDGQTDWQAGRRALVRAYRHTHTLYFFSESCFFLSYRYVSMYLLNFEPVSGLVLLRI